MIIHNDTNGERQNGESELLGLYEFGIKKDGLVLVRPGDFSLYKHRVYLISATDENHSTLLLRAMAGLLPHDLIIGRVMFEGLNIYEVKEKELDIFRKKTAFVFSEGTLIANLNVLENLILPIRYHVPQYKHEVLLEQIKAYFDFFKIPDILTQRPATLNYGIKKKLSFIRAALMEPELMLIDNPYFNLDNHAQEQVRTFLEELKRKGVTLVLAAPERQWWGELIDEIMRLEQGEIHTYETDKMETTNPKRSDHEF